MAGIRVVFIGMSPMLRDIVSRAIGSEMDMDIAGELFPDSWAQRLHALKPGAVIISLAHSEGDDVTSRLMKAAPDAKSSHSLPIIVAPYVVRRVVKGFSSTFRRRRSPSSSAGRTDKTAQKFASAANTSPISAGAASGLKKPTTGPTAPSSA